ASRRRAVSAPRSPSAHPQTCFVARSIAHHSQQAVFFGRRKSIAHRLPPMRSPPAGRRLTPCPPPLQAPSSSPHCDLRLPAAPWPATPLPQGSVPARTPAWRPPPGDDPASQRSSRTPGTASAGACVGCTRFSPLLDLRNVGTSSQHHRISLHRNQYLMSNPRATMVSWKSMNCRSVRLVRSSFTLTVIGCGGFGLLAD